MAWRTDFSTTATTNYIACTKPAATTTTTTRFFLQPVIAGHSIPGVSVSVRIPRLTHNPS